ncbi:MAG: hypothetical protein KAJ97_00795 [Acidobacteria bacterium]|nr:hypothetical protein [Acidobacteriota bacterium]
MRKRYNRAMAPRILFDESAVEPLLSTAQRVEAASPSRGPQLALADWDSPTRSVLMLYLEEEPQIGLDFRYNGLQWRIVDYRDGWVARLIVE